jgi:2,3-dihydroxybenzoate-AMP ligase
MTAAGTVATAGLDDPAARERWYLAQRWWTGETLPGYVLRHCEPDPGAEAVAGSGVRLTRGQLAAQVANAAAAFGSLGVGPGGRVLVQLPNEPALIVVVLALARIGAAAILAVPGLRERELRHVADTGQACAVVVNARAQHGANLAVATTLAATCPSVRHLIVSGPAPARGAIALWDLLARPARPAAPAPEPEPADVALYLLSGGTTGLPKLIPRTHRDYVLNLKVSAAVTRLDAASRYLAALPVCHNFALGCPGVLGTLAEGGRVVLTEARRVADAPRLMVREGITIAAAVPGLALGWAQQARLDQVSPRLRVLQVGGARLHAGRARDLATVLADTALGGTVQQVYGMAEGLLCFTRLDDPPEVIDGTQGRPASPGDQWRLTDETGADAPPGEPGELWVRGPYTIGGYLASRTVNDAAFAPGGWYRTGDIVRPHPSGNFVVEGRRKDFINAGGEKVSAEEVEELTETHPAVLQAAAIAAPSDLLGEEVCVCVTLRPGAAPPTLHALRRYLTSQGMAPYKLPARLRILAELPATAVGKLDKAELRRRESTQKE